MVNGERFAEELLLSNIGILPEVPETRGTTMKYTAAVFAAGLFAAAPAAAQPQHPPSHPAAPMGHPTMHAASPAMHSTAFAHRPTVHTAHHVTYHHVTTHAHHVVHHPHVVHHVMRATSHPAFHHAPAAVVARLRKNVVAAHRFHAGLYRAPPGWHYQRWTFGAYLPAIYFAPAFWISDFLAFDLFAPPDGYVWVRYGPDALLIDRYSGEIIQVEYGVFY
jgi:Ni/Co efflux regulator RcnB